MATRNNSTLRRPTNATQQPELSPSTYNIPLLVILSALIPLALVGNALVCVVFVKYQRLRTATNCFLFSLALSDLAVGLILIPCWIAYIVTQFAAMPNSLDTALTILDITCSVASMTNLMSVSIERWYGVSYPFRHMSMDTSKAALMACFSWLYAFGIGLLMLAEPQEWVFTVATVLGVCVPFFVMFVCYVGIAQKIKQKLNSSSQQQSGRERKTIRTLILVTTVFLICWFPFIIGSLVINYCETCAHYVNQRPVLRSFPKALHYSNSCINPLLYAVFSPSFKSAFKQLFCGVPPSRNQSRGRNGSSVNGQSVTASRTNRLNLTTSVKEKNSFKEKSSFKENNNLDSNKTLLLVGQTAV